MSVFIFASISWVSSAHKWFIGPIVNVDDDTSSNESSNEKDAEKRQT